MENWCTALAFFLVTSSVFAQPVPFYDNYGPTGFSGNSYKLLPVQIRVIEGVRDFPAQSSLLDLVLSTVLNSGNDVRTSDQYNRRPPGYGIQSEVSGNNIPTKLTIGSRFDSNPDFNVDASTPKLQSHLTTQDSERKRPIPGNGNIHPAKKSQKRPAITDPNHSNLDDSDWDDDYVYDDNEEMAPPQISQFHQTTPNNLGMNRPSQIQTGNTIPTKSDNHQVNALNQNFVDRVATQVQNDVITQQSPSSLNPSPPGGPKLPGSSSAITSNNPVGNSYDRVSTQVPQSLNQVAPNNAINHSVPSSVYKPNTTQRENSEFVYHNEEAIPPTLMNTTGYKAMQFALQLFKNLDRPTNGDSVISPLLPQQLLSNLIDFSSPEAKSQLLNVIRLHPDQLYNLTETLQIAAELTPSNTIKFATANFVSQFAKLNLAYQQSSRLRKVDLVQLDFTKPDLAARLANKWASEKTNQLINEILSPGSVDPNTRFLLANSIYFKGTWKHSFIQTEAGRFESLPGQLRRVNRMFQMNLLRYGVLNFSDGNGLRWVELPYEGDRLAMLIFLPTKRHELEASLQQLIPEDLGKVMAEMHRPYFNTKVHLHLPRFTLTDSVSLVPTLKRLGVSSIFHDANALRNLIKEPTVVSDVTQRTYLSVDELGTKASSVASLTAVMLSAIPQYQDVQFDVDQPFIAMIVDKRERYPIFIGQIYTPQE